MAAILSSSADSTSAPIVVFSDDNSGFAGPADDEALDAAHGRVVALLTRVNADSNDTGRIGTSSVEVYVPLTGQATRRPIAVPELHLPCGPIAHDVTTGLHRMYLALIVGLGVLYLTLFAISISVSRGLRRESVRNAFMAEHDALTELPNRTLFRQRATTAIRRSRRRERTVAVAIVDLDRFQEVNDTLGHDSGDQLLIELAGRLAGAMRPGDTVPRLGGDEFGLILRGAADVERLLRELRGVIDGEVELSGLPVSGRRALATRSRPRTGPTSTSSCSGPTWRCTRRSPVTSA